MPHRRFAFQNDAELFILHGGDRKASKLLPRLHDFNNISQFKGISRLEDQGIGGALDHAAEECMVDIGVGILVIDDRRGSADPGIVSREGFPVLRHRDLMAVTGKALL